MLTVSNIANQSPLSGVERYRLTEMYFRAVMTTIIHEDSVSFADKVVMVENYMQVCPNWKHDAMRLQDALDRINPAYAGMTEFRTCGERFCVKQGEWEDTEIGAMLRCDSYLHVKTQVTHLISYVYQVGMKTGTIVLDGKLVFSGKVNSFNDLPKEGVNQLLIKIGVLV